MPDFVGREDELHSLKLLLKKKVASFVVIRGRRRVGKSRLIREFSKDLPCKLLTGSPPIGGTTKKKQLHSFCGHVARVFGIPKFTVDDWGDLFFHLGKLCAKGRLVLALDEISWMGSKDPEFLGQLKNAWDLYFSQNPKLILIVCGSVSSWIEKNILSSTGFVGRISLDIRLKELPLHQAVQFWNSHHPYISGHEILKILSVTGCVPRYLEEILPHLSADENIRQLCFEPHGFLYGEFDKIFSDIFSSRAPAYASILQQLTSSSRAIPEITEASDFSRRATVSNLLNDLAQAGFVTADPTWNLRTMKISSMKQYRLSDNYLRFYLRYIYPLKQEIERNIFKSALPSHLPGWDTMMGLQFENLVLNNVWSVVKAMRLEPAEIAFYGPYFQRKTARHQGCQIDLLIQTRHRTLYLCEIKFSVNKVGMSVVEQVRRKQESITLPRGWSSRLVLIHVNGISRDVQQSGTFDHIIDFQELLQP